MFPMTGVVREFICIAVLQRHTGAVSINPPLAMQILNIPCRNLMRNVYERACKE